MSPRVGVVFVRRTGAPQREEFFQRIIGGLDETLGDAGASLLVARVDDLHAELGTYAHWRATDAVDSVVLKDLAVIDPRPDELRRLDLAAVALCDTHQAEWRAAVCFDNTAAARLVLEFLLRLGHRRIARISGPRAFVHTQVRTRAFDAVAVEGGLVSWTREGDYSDDAGQALTAELLASSPRPTAIVYDNDLMALGGQRAARRLGCTPDDVALFSWDDSVACQLADPPLTALGHDVTAMGRQLAQVALELSRGLARREDAAAPVVVERGSTGRARHPSPTNTENEGEPS